MKITETHVHWLNILQIRLKVTFQVLQCTPWVLFYFFYKDTFSQLEKFFNIYIFTLLIIQSFIFLLVP